MIISHSRGRGKKIHLMLDGEYQITTDIDFWAEHYIKDGTQINNDEWQELVDEINFKKAVNKCYDLLSRRDHSVKELKLKLLRTVDEDNANKAIEQMLAYGYLNDEVYAKNLLKHLIENKKMSKNFIKQEMAKRGLSPEIINNTLEDAEIDNVSAAVDLILSKYANKLNENAGQNKIIAALMRRGFSYYDIRSAIEMIENDEYI